jgi:hypothetical protein
MNSATSFKVKQQAFGDSLPSSASNFLCFFTQNYFSSAAEG